MENEVEVWKDIKGYEGLYEISSNGKVKSYFLGMEMKLQISRDGYYQIGLTKNKKQKTFPIHKLVALAFISETYLSEGLTVDHIDRDRKNNKTTNLRVLSLRYNIHNKEYKNKERGATDSGSCFMSYICHNGKQYYIGSFADKNSAVDKYNQALVAINNGTFKYQDFKPIRKPFKGYSYMPSRKKWMSYYYVNGKRKHNSYHNTKEEAILSIKTKLNAD